VVVRRCTQEPSPNFFDGIALLVPSYMNGKPEEVDPIMVQPLKKAGLLHILEPEILVDKA
jgi:hypothetical protein